MTDARRPRPAGWPRLFALLCLLHVTSANTEVEPRPSAVDSLLEDLTAVLQQAQRLEQAGVPAIQRVQQHLAAFLSQVEDAQKSLWVSVMGDDAQGLEAAVRRGALIERRNTDGMSPLALAAKEGRVHAVWGLLKLGAAVNATAGEEDWTPLMWAQVHGHRDCVALLRAAAGKVGDAQTALWEAVARDDAKGTEAAARLGADLESRRDSDAMTPLALAAKEGRVGALSTLLRLGANVTATAGTRDWSPLLWALFHKQNQSVALLREAGAEAEDAQMVLWKAVASDDADGTEVAVRLGADLESRRDSDAMTPLALAAKEGRVGALSALLRLGANVTATAGARDWPPLLWARVHRQYESAALLRKAAPLLRKMTRKEAQDLLWAGVKEGDQLAIEQAVLYGADTEEKRDGMTPLTEAADQGRVEAVSALVRLGAAVEGRAGEWQWCPLYWAARGGHERVVRVLLAAGASVRTEAKNRNTPLHGAAYWGHLNTARLLVEAGAELSAKNSEGKTPLEQANQQGEAAVAAYLRSLEANL